MNRIVKLLMFTLIASGCSAGGGGKDLALIFEELSVQDAYRVIEIRVRPVGWNDSFQSGSAMFTNEDALGKVLKASKEVGNREYIPIEGSLLIPELERSTPPQIWLYKSKGKRDRRIYFVVKDDQIIFDLLVF